MLIDNYLQAMKKLILITIFALAGGSLYAQDLLRGSVREAGTNSKMPDVFVRDITTKQIALTDDKGDYEIKAATGHTLIYSSPGYISDTLFVVDMKPKNVQLKTMSIALREVNISGKQNFNPITEYPDVYEKSRVYVLSPSSWFGKDAKDARRLKRFFNHEAEERQVDQVFTRVYVGSIVPLKGQDLEAFMMMYRPTYAFIKDNNGPSLVAYINDSYKKFMALPPDKRKMPDLNAVAAAAEN
jgi:hypothetical protein